MAPMSYKFILQYEYNIFGCLFDQIMFIFNFLFEFIIYDSAGGASAAGASAGFVSSVLGR